MRRQKGDVKLACQFGLSVFLVFRSMCLAFGHSRSRKPFVLCNSGLPDYVSVYSAPSLKGDLYTRKKMPSWLKKKTRCCLFIWGFFMRARLWSVGAAFNLRAGCHVYIICCWLGPAKVPSLFDYYRLSPGARGGWASYHSEDLIIEAGFKCFPSWFCPLLKAAVVAA